MKRTDFFVERTDHFLERSDHWLERSDLERCQRSDHGKINEMTDYRHAPSRLPMNKLKSLLQKTRKVTLFVLKSIRKNTLLSSGIHCYVKNRKGLHLNRYRSNCNSVKFLLKRATPKLVRKRGKVYLSSKHQSTGDLGGMRYPNRLLSKNLPLCTCNYPFYSA